MKILLTNDDGIDAEGLDSLYRILSQQHDVYVIAPDRERSACSNMFTIRTEIGIKQVDSRRYAISGYPADCVSIALHGDIVPDVDLVISGINHGPNIGDDVFFSGTVGGARTAFIFGKSAIAFSVDSFHRASDYFDEASEFVMKFIEEKKDEPGYFFNINYPDIPQAEIKGVKYTFTGRRIYRDYYKKEVSADDDMTLKLVGEVESVPVEGSDVTEMEKGYISVTPLSLDCTDFEYLNKMKG